MKNFLIFLFLGILLTNCSAFKADVDPITGKKIRKEPSLKKRAEDSAAEGGGIFNSSNMKGGTTYDFATSNVMWRATLSSLDFLPLQSVNYSGGVVITDWYSNSINSNESIKIEVRFLSDETSSSSINILSYKKICENLNCKTLKMDEKFNKKIKDQIMEEVRKLKIQEELDKNKKKKT